MSLRGHQAKRFQFSLAGNSIILHLELNNFGQPCLNTQYTQFTPKSAAKVQWGKHDQAEVCLKVPVWLNFKKVSLLADN